MINIVSDDQVIINVNMGIRNVTWGESKGYSMGNRGNYFITISYKNGNNTFYYETESKAREIFNKVLDAMMQRNKIKE